MTEQEWLTCSDPAKMLAWATSRTVSPGVALERSVISDRKLRLFACACAWQAWHLLTDERSRQAVKVAERFADEQATDAERIEAFRSLQPVPVPQMCVANCLVENQHWPRPLARIMEEFGTAPQQAALVREVVGNPYRPVLRKCNDGCNMRTSGRGDKPHHCHTHKKDVVYVGTDKRTRYAVCPDSLEYFRGTYCTPTVLSLAQAAYDERKRKCDRYPKWEGVEIREGFDAVQAVIDFGKLKKKCVCKGTGTIDDGALDPFRLALVADALEEEGYPAAPGRAVSEVVRLQNTPHRACCNRFADQMGCDCLETAAPDGILAHLRSAGPHVRGCRVLDLILGKQ